MFIYQLQILIISHWPVSKIWTKITLGVYCLFSDTTFPWNESTVSKILILSLPPFPPSFPQLLPLKYIL